MTAEPGDKQNKTIVAEMTSPRVHTDKQDKTVEATHAAIYEAALKEAAPDSPQPSVGDAAAALKDATLRELGAAREKASTKIKQAARAARRNAPAWRRVGRWALGLLALAVVFAGGFFLGERRGGRRSVVTSAPVADTAPPSANQANALTNHVLPTDAPANEPPVDASSTDASSTCRTRPSADSLFENIVNDILGLRAQPRPRRAEPLDAFVRRMLSPAPRVVPTMDVSFGWPGLELTVPFLQDERAARDRAVRQEQHQRLVDPLSHQAARVQQRRLEEQRRLEHARQEAARAAQVQQRRLEENARRQASHRRAQTAKATAIQDLEERLAKAEAAREEQRRLRTDVVETAAVDAEPAVELRVEPTPASTRPARDALRELSIKQLRNILAARGGAPCTTCKEKDDLVAAVMAVLDD